VEGLRSRDPQKIGPYRLLGRLGVGGMGEVFLCRSPGGRLIAVKIIRAELAEDRNFRARFAREVAAARRVSGLFTAPVVDADVDGPVPWLATAYIAGPSLEQAVTDHGPLPSGSVLTLAAALAESLVAIHSAGVVHRDLTPRNVLLAQDGPRVIDFGISRTAGQGSLTSTNVVLGTPGFMSPEQVAGDNVGPASDMFSLGAILTFAATRQGPFGTGSASALVYRIGHNAPEINHLPGKIRHIVEQCLTKDPRRRPTAAELLAQLGTAHPAAEWLPSSLADTLRLYAQPESIVNIQPIDAR
jgi:serine/threonine protein kinase